MDDRAREIVKNLLAGLAKDYGLEFSDTDASDAITDISAYGDEREREALDALLQLFNMVNYALDSRDALLISRTCATMDEARVLLESRSLIKTTPEGETK